MTQTAVDFLINEFSEILGPLETKPMQDLLMMAAMKQAKEMDKEQIMNSFADGFVEGVETQKSGEQLLFPEQYYNETYGEK